MLWAGIRASIDLVFTKLFGSFAGAHVARYVGCFFLAWRSAVAVTHRAFRTGIQALALLGAAEELRKLGGASVILATAPSSKAMSEIFQGLGRNGSLLVVGADMAPLKFPARLSSNGRKRVQGWAPGTPSNSEDTLRFAAHTGVCPMIEKFPLQKAGEAHARMLSGHALFRLVLTV